MDLPDGVTYKPNFLPEKDRLFSALNKLSWSQHQIPMFGKKIPAPRMFAWMGTPPRRVYGEPIPITPWTSEAKEIRDAVHKETGILFDSLNINMYRNQDDYIGWHIDPKDEGLWNFPIASVSFGSERVFQTREYHRVTGQGRIAVPGTVREILLEAGSLLTMPPQFQAGWEHRLPKRAATKSTRINLTFRRMEA